MSVSRYTLFKVPLIIGICALGLFISCEKKLGCTDSRAENYDPDARKDDESCIMPREKFLGNYVATSVCSSTPTLQYESEVIAANDNLTDIFIENLGGIINAPVRGIVSGNTLTIPEQNAEAIGRYVSGNGLILGNIINITYSYRLGNGNGNNTVTCNIEMIK
jgi:hypothetical protein